MRSFALGLAALLAVPSLAFAAVDPAEREAALQYERTVQEGNKALREAKAQAEAMLTSLLAGKTPSEKELGDAIDGLQKAASDLQRTLKTVPVPASPEGKAYSLSVNGYLDVLTNYEKDHFLKALQAVQKPTGNAEQDVIPLFPLMRLSRNTKLAIQGIRNTRPAFLAAYEITAADLIQAPAPVARAPVSPADAAPAPAAGPAALYQTIREGEQEFSESVKEVQRKLLPKLLLGGEIDPAEIAVTFTDIQAALDKFEMQVAAAKAPDDPESQAFAESAQKLVAATKKVDFAAVAKLFTDPNLSAEDKQAQLIKTMTGLEAGIREEFKAYNLAKAAFRKKHGIVEPGEAAAEPPM